MVESRWQNERRRRKQKKQRQLNITVLLLILGVVMALGITLVISGYNLSLKNAELEEQKLELQSQIDRQIERQDELDEYKKYVQTKKFFEETARNRFGLIYPDEILVKPQD